MDTFVPDVNIFAMIHVSVIAQQQKMEMLSTCTVICNLIKIFILIYNQITNMASYVASEKFDQITLNCALDLQ